MKKEISTVSTKTYAVADSKGEFYVSEAINDGSVHKRLSIKGFDKGTPQNIKLFATDIIWAEKVQKEFSKSAPMYVEVFHDSNLITDQQKKADILDRLAVVELANKISVSIKSLNAAGIKSAKEEIEVKKHVSSLMHQFSKNVNTLPISKCKKIKEMLSDLNS